jgi:hypothetical protein
MHTDLAVDINLYVSDVPQKDHFILGLVIGSISKSYLDKHGGGLIESIRLASIGQMYCEQCGPKMLFEVSIIYRYSVDGLRVVSTRELRAHYVQGSDHLLPAAIDQDDIKFASSLV